jgi:hypothetical protein
MQATTEKPGQIGSRRAVWTIMFGILVPLIVIALILTSIGNSNALFLPLLDGFKTASAIILSFLGGIRWGSELRNKVIKPLILFATIIPVAIGWTCLFLSGPLAIGLLLIAVCAMGAWDSFYWHEKANIKWYASVRTVMTLIAAFMHSLVLLTIL